MSENRSSGDDSTDVFTGVEQAVLASDPANAPDPNTRMPILSDSDYTKGFSYTADELLGGIFETGSTYLSVEDYWDVQYVYEQVEYTVSPLIDDVPASLTFSINDTPVYSCKVSYENGETQVVYVEIPVSLLKVGYNKFSITGYARLYDDEGCLDDLNGANWIRIMDSSFVEFGYNLVDFDGKLSFYPYPFISTVDESGDDLVIYVPDDATGEELAAALLLRADLSAETDKTDQIRLRMLSEYGTDETRHSIIVALDGNLPEAVEARLDFAGRDLSAKCMVAILQEGDGATLVLTSEKGAGLLDGVNMLLDENRVTQETGSSAYVTIGAADEYKAAAELSDLIAGSSTVESLAGAGITFVGPFHQSSTLYLPVSGGFVLGQGGKIVLNMRYSENLDFKRSLVTVYWGTIPVYSKALEKDKANGDILSFILPDDVVGTYASSIQIVFDLELEDLYCTKRADQMPWAYVSGDSTFYLPVGNSNRYSFGTRPYPFMRLGLFDASVVVPDEMTATQLDALGQLIATLGGDLAPYGTLTVLRASEFTVENAQTNLIMIGTYEDNPAIVALNDKLSFQYAQNGDQFVSNAQLILSDEYARDLCVLQLIQSPYSSDCAVLIASGTEQDEIERMGEFLSDKENKQSLSGDAFLIAGDQSTKSFTFLREIRGEELTITDQIEKNKTAIIYTVVSSAAMLILFFAIILIIAHARRTARRDAEK